MEEGSKPEKRIKRFLRRIWGMLPTLMLVLVVYFAVWMLFLRIESKAGVQIRKQIASAADLLKNYGVTREDITEIISKKFGEKNFDALMKKADEMAKAPQKQQDVNVVTLELVPSLIRDRINLPGITEPWVKLKVLAEVRGKIIQKSISEGESVKQGSIIAVLDSRDYKNAYNSAKASYEAAVNTLDRLKKLQKDQLSTRSQLDDALAQAENFKAAMDTAELEVERCTIRAPISGVANQIFIENGQYINMSDAIAEILQIDKIKVKVGIPESDVDAVRNLTDFNVTIDALQGKIFRAKKHFLSKTADEMARLYSLELKLENPGGEILPDMFTRVEIVKKNVPESISVPLYSIISRNRQNILFVEKNNRVNSRPVQIGLQEGWRVEITDGLSAGERVVIVGHRSLNDGQSVNVVRSVKDPEEILR